MSTVRLRHATIKSDGRPVLTLESPYHPEFPALAKHLGGKWDGLVWIFDRRDEIRVAELCERIWGINPLGPPPELVTVQITISTDEALDQHLWAFGRMVVERRHYDDDIWLGESVVIINGAFFLSAGSRREPVIGRPKSPVTLEIRDVPAAMLAREKRAYTIVEDQLHEDASIEQRIGQILAQIQSLPPAGQTALLLRLRDVRVLDDR